MSAHQRLGRLGRRGGFATARATVAFATAAFCGALLCITVLGTTAAPAMAHSMPFVVVGQADGEPGFSFSIDGNKFSESVPELFADAPKLVPGEGVERRLWVRNNNEVKMNVSVIPQTTAKTDETAWAEVVPSADIALAPGEAAPLLVRLELPEFAGNDSQDKSLPVKLRLNFSEAVAQENGPLAHTGSGSGIWPLAGVTLLGGVGAYLVSRKRKVRQ